MTELLLHSCCAPCTIVPLEAYAQKGYSLSVAFINPNITQTEEYDLRRSTFEHYVTTCDVNYIKTIDDPLSWESLVGSSGGPYPLIANDPAYSYNLTAKQARCRQCYRLRLNAAAALALEHDIKFLASTLTISPYQFTDTVIEEAEAACALHGLTSVCEDFRDSYPESVRRSREMGMYRQNYCGCRFSKEERRIEKEYTAAQNKAQKTAEDRTQDKDRSF